MSAPAAAGYHACECYGHDLALPDYQHDVSVPRTLQGYYAKEGGCPCHATSASRTAAGNSCVCGAPAGSVSLKKSYRASSGPHTVHRAAEDSSTTFRNSANYGGTVEQRGPTTLRTTAQLGSTSAKRQKAKEKKEESQQDRKNFLKAVLRDEMLARMDAEAKRDALEQQTGLMGSNHAVAYEEARLAGGSKSGMSTDFGRGGGALPSVPEQYAEVMEELRYVGGQPVGSKYNINRLYYLLEEEARINELRRSEKTAARSTSA